MSKMSQLHMELSEQAAEYGFEDLGEAEQAGFGVDWENHKLLPPEEAAHRALLIDKERLLADLDLVVTRSQFDKGVIERAKEMIRTEVK